MPHEHKTEYHLVMGCGDKQGQTPDSEFLVVRNGYQIKYLSLKRFRYCPRMPGPGQNAHMGLQTSSPSKGLPAIRPFPSRVIYHLFPGHFFPHPLNGGNGSELQRRGWRFNISKVLLKIRAGSHQSRELSHYSLLLVEDI